MMKCKALKDFEYSYALKGRDGIRTGEHSFMHRKGDTFYAKDEIITIHVKIKNCKELK